MPGFPVAGFTLPMSDTRSFTVRLSTEDQAILQTLADLFAADRSETMRRALRLALAQQRPPAVCGQFIPAKSSGVKFTVRVQGETNHE